jgi:hypothetical protein
MISHRLLGPQSNGTRLVCKGPCKGNEFNSPNGYPAGTKEARKRGWLFSWEAKGIEGWLCPSCVSYIFKKNTNSNQKESIQTKKSSATKTGSISPTPICKECQDATWYCICKEKR